MTSPRLVFLPLLLSCSALAGADEGEQAFTAPEALTEFTTRDEELGEENPSLPRIRLEIWLRGGGLGSTRVKKGPQYNAHMIQLHRDTHVPRIPVFGFRAVAEIRFHEDWSLGAHLTAALLKGPKRTLHYRGVSLQGRTLAPQRSRTSVEMTFAQAFVRRVFRDNARIRLSFGAGVSWISFRLRIRNRDQRSDGRIQDVLAPSIGYFFSFRLFEHLAVWVESTNALISPMRFPSYATEARAGLRFPFGAFEFAAGVGVSSAQLEDVRELWGGEKPPATYRWRRASWTLVTLELGMSVRF